MTAEGTSVTQADKVTEELEPTGVIQLLEVDQEQPSEQLCEHANRQQDGFARGEPLACRCSLALGAVPIPAAVVGDAMVAAVLATFDVAAECGGTASLDRRHHLELGQAHVPGLRRSPG